MQSLRFQLWFILELPQFIRQIRATFGVELGVKAGRSIRRVLAHNPGLRMIGLDLWEVIPGRAYRGNVENESRCRKALARFGERAALFKGDANQIAGKVEDHSLDFVFYDLYNHRVSMPELHDRVIGSWVPKLRSGGYFIGRDFHQADLREVIERRGFHIEPCVIHGRTSERLKYFRVACLLVALLSGPGATEAGRGAWLAMSEAETATVRTVPGQQIPCGWHPPAAATGAPCSRLAYAGRRSAA